MTGNDDHPGLTCAEAQQLIDHYRRRNNNTLGARLRAALAEQQDRKKWPT